MANGYFVGAINRVGWEAPWKIGEFYGKSYFCDPRGQDHRPGAPGRGRRGRGRPQPGHDRRGPLGLAVLPGPPARRLRGPGRAVAGFAPVKNPEPCGSWARPRGVSATPHLGVGPNLSRKCMEQTSPPEVDHWSRPFRGPPGRRGPHVGIRLEETPRPLEARHDRDRRHRPVRGRYGEDPAGHQGRDEVEGERHRQEAAGRLRRPREEGPDPGRARQGRAAGPGARGQRGCSLDQGRPRADAGRGRGARPAVPQVGHGAGAEAVLGGPDRGLGP